MADSVIGAVRSFVARSLAPLVERMGALEQRLSAIPAPERGPAGADGADGAPGEKGEKGEKGDSGPAGPAGADGADAFAIACAEGFSGSRRQWVESLAGKDGADGCDGRDGAEGPPGRDALHTPILTSIDESRRYARGTYASHRGGLIFATRATEPVTGSLEASGWQVVVSGFAMPEFEFSDDARTLTVRASTTAGDVVEKKVALPTIMDRGVYRQEERYTRGDAVTWGGSLWIAQRESGDRPGASDAWRLAVKCGRDGKDGKDGERGLPGRDGRAS